MTRELTTNNKVRNSIDKVSRKGTKWRYCRHVRHYHESELHHPWNLAFIYRRQTLVQTCMSVRANWLARKLFKLDRKKCATLLKSALSYLFCLCRHSLMEFAASHVSSMQSLSLTRGPERGSRSSEFVRSGLSYEQPPAMSRSPQIKMTRWPKVDKWEGKMY